MQHQKIDPRFALLLLIIAMAAIMRISNSAQITAWSNFSPVGAMGLFGGAYFKTNWKKFTFPILTLLVSDLVINLFVLNGKYGVMYSGWYLVYGIFIGIVVLGSLLLKKVSAPNVLLASVSAALLHWFIADFAVWVAGGTDLRTGLPLSRDWSGLQQCYWQGFPFMRNFLAGTMGYGALMFGIVEWAKNVKPRLFAQG